MGLDFKHLHRGRRASHLLQNSQWSAHLMQILLDSPMVGQVGAASLHHACHRDDSYACCLLSVWNKKQFSIKTKAARIVPSSFWRQYGEVAYESYVQRYESHLCVCIDRAGFRLLLLISVLYSGSCCRDLNLQGSSFIQSVLKWKWMFES